MQYDMQEELEDADMQNVDAFKDPSEFLVNVGYLLIFAAILNCFE